jgi:hypothetical protein
MNAEELTRKWVEKTLTVGEIDEYLWCNIIDASEPCSCHVKHIAEGLHAIYLWSTAQIPELGSFLQAVVKNDLTEAVHRADEHNKIGLWLYVAFLYNVAPAGWRNNEKFPLYP